MPHGGPRENSGRPPGSPSQRTVAMAVKLATDGGETPFSILLKSARAFWAKAAPTDGVTVEDFQAARDAAEVAAKAAPYVHPRLNSINIDNDGSPLVIKFDREDRDA